MQPAIEMINMTKTYPGVVACDNVSLKVNEGEILGLIGENGAGKSTMMNLLYGMTTADTGQIMLNGEEIHITSPNKAIEFGIGMVHQHFMLMPNLTVLQNIILGKVPTQKGLINKDQAKKEITKIMDAYGMHVNLDETVIRLSVGEKQRVEILKSLYRGAKILILDEPTAVLTPAETDKLLDVLVKLKNEGSSIIFITHKLREIKKISDCITVMRKGLVTGSIDTKDATDDILSELMVGKVVDLNIPRKPFKPGKTVLGVHELSAVGEKGLISVDDVTFDVREAEIVGIAGVEGNGQSELAEVISGMLDHTAGRITLYDEDITLSSVRNRRESGISHIPEDRIKIGGALDLSIKDNIISNRYYQKDYGKNGFMDHKKLVNLAEESCVKFGVKTPDSTYQLGTLSGGNMQKVVFAREMEMDPKFIIAAQPTRGVDIGAIAAIHTDLIAARDSGKAILLISAELDEILSLSDRIFVMYEGKITAQFMRVDATENALAKYMTGAKRKEEATP